MIFPTLQPPERSTERDAAIDAVLAHVPFDGWTQLALERALIECGGHGQDAPLLFPGGPADMVAAYCDLADRRMVADAAAALHGETSLTKRVRILVAARLASQRGNREAIRRALAVLALPHNAPVAAACAARTADAIWHAAGDPSVDFSWYTRRAILAAVYSATLLFWLRDDSDDNAATLAFLDRRLAAVGRLGTLRRRAEGVAARWLPGPLRRLIAGPENPATAR